jgi:competence protein ComEC
MKQWCLAFATGIVLASFLPDLPSPLVALFLLALLPAAWCVYKKIAVSASVRYLALFTMGLVAGFVYGILAGHRLLSQQLPIQLAGEAIWVEGTVAGLPETDERRQLFELEVYSARLGLQLDALKHFAPPKILLSSYGRLRVKTGETWRLQVKLKPPRGFVNPGGFDYQASLLRQGVGATGYIRDSYGNRLLVPAQVRSFDVLRYELQQWLVTHSHSAEKSILIALLVGDTSLVSPEQWGDLSKTGTNHLIAISGLHLGFFAIAGFFIGELIGRFIQLAWHRCPASVPGHLFAMGFTLFYSLVAGMNIPTLRTLIMLAVVHMACLSRRNFSISDVFILALVCVLLYDSLAAFDVGFWLSFGAVAVLLFCFSGRLDPGTHKRHFILTYLREYLKSQWIMFIGLLIPLVLLVNTSSLLAPLANLIAIPLITFFVVPCLIVAAICQQLFSYEDTFFLTAAEWGTEFFRHWLQSLLNVGVEQLNPVLGINSSALPLALLGVFLLLLPAGLRKTVPAVCAVCLSLLIPLAPESPLRLLVFDVGQGTAVLVRTAHHQLLYDTGPRFTDHFDAGSGIITPYLHSQGLRKFNALVVSHNDDDHSGGMEAVLNNFHIDHLWLGEPEEYSAQDNQPEAEDCQKVAPWQWDGVSFRFIQWEAIPGAKSNNRSCVLLVEYKEQKILLTGDIEKPVEQRLQEEKALPQVDILLAPHHGSKTSSTAGFVAETYPKYVIYSAGFRNQHGHPHGDVRARYQRINARELNTAFGGALEFNWQDGEFALTEYRLARRRYWFGQDQGQ